MTATPGGASGKFLCRIAAIPDGGAKGFPLPGEPHPRAILLVRQGHKIHGYRNRCPHQGTPLDWTPDGFFDFSKTYLQCATHGAQFRAEDGFCVTGPCRGKSLERVSLRMEADEIYLERPAP